MSRKKRIERAGRRFVRAGMKLQRAREVLADAIRSVEVASRESESAWMSLLKEKNELP